MLALKFIYGEENCPKKSLQIESYILKLAFPEKLSH
jgi:hypothetical protein